MLTPLSIVALQVTATNVALWGVAAVLLFAIVARRRSRKAKTDRA
jgi:MYXO-CTERM domain-containing protein